MCADAPDTSGQNAAALASAELSKEQLDWIKQIYADEAPARAAAAARANAVSDAQVGLMNKASEQSDKQQAVYDSTFAPIEKKIAADALGYDTEARREKAAGLALADVNQQYSAAQEASNRNLTRMGVNPSDGATTSAQNSLTMGRTLAGVQAANQARTQVETLGTAKLADAANLGRGIASNQATQVGLANQTGSSAANSALASLNPSNTATAQMQNGFNGAQSSLNSAGNLYGQAAQTQASANSGLLAGLGGLAQAGAKGYAAWIGSDKNEKENVRPLDGKKSLAAIREMPIGLWNYRKDSKFADGQKTHAGPMAQDAHLRLGDAVAPGGKKIDLISMNGHTLAAVKELDREVRGLKDALPKHAKKAPADKKRGPSLADARRG